MERQITETRLNHLPNQIGVHVHSDGDVFNEKAVAYLGAILSQQDFFFLRRTAHSSNLFFLGDLYSGRSDKVTIRVLKEHLIISLR